MEKIIKLLKKIQNETQDINHNFIYDFLADNKNDIDRNDFLEKVLKNISNNYEFDEKRILADKIEILLSDERYSKGISFNDFIDDLAETVPIVYKVQLDAVFKDYGISEAKICKFAFDTVELIYPYFDSIFFVETQDQYIIFSLGYVD